MINKYGLTTRTGYYSVDRYPWAYAAWQNQQHVHWLPEEVPMADDVNDWLILPENEKNLLAQIFRLFTQSDIEVADNYFKRFIPIFQPLEIQMMMAAFTNIETVHIEAYAYLIKTLGMPEAEFKAFKNYSAMRAKVDYMDTFGVSDEKGVAASLAMFGAFTEGLSLFASFAMLLNFPRHNKMKGMGQIITWSIRDETLHCESMIKLYHAWVAETGVDVKDDVRAICEQVVRLEDNFIDTAFELGGVAGMQPQDVKNYIRYIADHRLRQLRIDPIFGTNIADHPLPWLSALLNGVEHANFFEARATEYSKAATKGNWSDVWNEVDK